MTDIFSSCGSRPPVAGRGGSRRELLFVSVPSIVSFPALGIAATNAKLELVSYRDEQDRFEMLRPVSWKKVDKDGAKVLFEDPENKSNSLGVVVSPVRISSLVEFGGPELVASKLVQAERNKASTKSVELLGAESRGSSTSPTYEIEYRLDSTRGGLKRVYSAVTVSSRKLYVINLAIGDASLDDEELRDIVESFEII